MKVLLTSIGTRGEVQPLLALALELRGLGHAARICAPPNFQAWVESFGIEFAPVGVDTRQFVTRGARQKQSRRSLRAQASSMVAQAVQNQFQVMAEAASGCDLILTAGGIQTAGSAIAELRKIPYVFATYCPVTLPSPAHPPPFVRPQRLPRLINRLLWASYESMSSRVFRDAVNSERRRLGLEPVANVTRSLSTERPWVAADPALAPAETRAAVQVGAWLFSDPAPLPADLEEFLRDGEPPIYFGLGSSGAEAKMGQLFLDAARRVGRRAVISRGWSELAVDTGSGDCLVIGDVNHERLFPQVAAIVHHGGAGTTTSAARAGRPQVVAPDHFDQFYWAHRVQTLGIGARARRTLDDLVPALRACLQPETSQKARALSAAMQLDGTRRTAELLLTSLRSSGPRSGSSAAP